MLICTVTPWWATTFTPHLRFAKFKTLYRDEVGERKKKGWEGGKKRERRGKEGGKKGERRGKEKQQEGEQKETETRDERVTGEQGPHRRSPTPENKRNTASSRAAWERWGPNRGRGRRRRGGCRRAPADTLRSLARRAGGPGLARRAPPRPPSWCPPPWWPPAHARAPTPREGPRPGDPRPSGSSWRRRCGRGEVRTARAPGRPAAAPSPRGTPAAPSARVSPAWAPMPGPRSPSLPVRWRRRDQPSPAPAEGPGPYTTLPLALARCSSTTR
jgi:hypothetical protein